jgi:hypothetical protein
LLQRTSPRTSIRAILSRFTERLVIPLPDLKSRIRMFQIVFCQTKIDSLFTRDDALLGELSSGMSLQRYSQLAGSRTAPGCIEGRSKRRKCRVQCGLRGSVGLCSAGCGNCAVAQLGICGLSLRFRVARRSKSILG